MDGFAVPGVGEIDLETNVLGGGVYGVDAALDFTVSGFLFGRGDGGSGGGEGDGGGGDGEGFEGFAGLLGGEGEGEEAEEQGEAHWGLDADRSALQSGVVRQVNRSFRGAGSVFSETLGAGSASRAPQEMRKSAV